MTDVATACVRAGVRPDATTGALQPPLVQSTAYRWEGFEGPPAHSYARSGNATVAALEERLTALEGGEAAVCFSSGLAAIDALLRLYPPGARIVVGRHVYGGTTRLLHDVHAGRFNVVTVDSSSRAEVEEALSTRADLVLVETPTNPTLRITDLAHVIEWGHRAGAFVAVDNTFLTPLWQRPLDLGADASIHSTTKYLDGHGLTLGGAVVLGAGHGGSGIDEAGAAAPRLRWIRQATGTNLAPFEAWLTLHGSKTLHLRTRHQWEAAARVAERLGGAEEVTRVYYPGLHQHPGHDVHRAQARGDGGIVAVDLGSRAAAARFVEALQLFTLAENLGCTESLVSSPALMTHAALPPERRAEDGIPDGLVRLSCGVEAVEDLVADIDRALHAVRNVQAVPA